VDAEHVLGPGLDVAQRRDEVAVTARAHRLEPRGTDPDIERPSRWCPDTERNAAIGKEGCPETSHARFFPGSAPRAPVWTSCVFPARRFARGGRTTDGLQVMACK